MSSYNAPPPPPRRNQPEAHESGYLPPASPRHPYSQGPYAIDPSGTIPPDDQKPFDPYWETGEIQLIPTTRRKTQEIQWQAEQIPPPKRRRLSRRQRIMRTLIALGGAGFATLLVAGTVFAIVGKSWYQSLPPFEQEVWCNRVEMMCDWKPTPPFRVLPTLPPSENNISPEDLLLTPFTFDSGGSLTPSPSSTSQSTGANPANTGGDPSNLSVQTSPLPTNTPWQDVATATLLPTASITPLPSPTAAATFTPQPPPSSAFLNRANLRSEAQRWNNCGPTTLTMGLSYFGYSNDQVPAADFLKPDIEDKNVSPWQLVRYVNEAQGLVNTQALYRIGGTQELMKRLLAADFPVIIEKGYEPDAELGWMGHYLLLVGYDDNLIAPDGTPGVFYTFDSYAGTNSGNGRQESYSYIHYYWRQFNNTFVVLYPPERAAELTVLLGPYAEPMLATTLALEQARFDATVDANDKWAWLNMGDAYTLLGQYQEAVSAFNEAFRLQLPWRLLWYRFSPFEAYFRLAYYDQVLQMAADLERSSQGYVEEAWYYRGLVYAAQGDIANATAQFERALTFNRNFTPASQALLAVKNGTFVATQVAVVQ